MLTKVKRIKRKKYAAGDEAREFEKIPTASQPVQQKIGARDELLDRYVKTQVKSPELADAAKQAYTTQAVQTDELLAGTTQAAPTDIGPTTITGQTIGTPTALTAAQAATPTAPTTSTMTAGLGTAKTGTAQTGAVGTQAQIGAVTGTLTGTATGATAGPYNFCSSTSCFRKFIWWSFSSSINWNCSYSSWTNCNSTWKYSGSNCN